MISKVFEKLVNNRVVDHLEKCGLIFSMVSRSSQSMADLLTVVSYRISMALDRFGATSVVVVDIFKALTRFCMLVFLTSSNLMESRPYFIFSQ